MRLKASIGTRFFDKGICVFVKAITDYLKKIEAENKTTLEALKSALEHDAGKQGMMSKPLPTKP